MPRPSKPVNVIKSEKKSHRTKDELKMREFAEESLLSGCSLSERQEVKNNTIAHSEFLRLNRLLKNIDKNDDLYCSAINRYCLLYAECRDFEVKRENFHQLIYRMEEQFDGLKADIPAEERAKTLRDFAKAMSELSKQVIALDSQVMSKRRMMLDIEKECVMTVASALRSIPKNPEHTVNPLLEALGGD